MEAAILSTLAIIATQQVWDLLQSTATSVTTTPEAIANPSELLVIASIGSLAVTVGTVIGLVFTFLKVRDADGIATRAEKIGD